MVRKSKHEDELGVEFAIADWDMQRTQSSWNAGANSRMPQPRICKRSSFVSISHFRR